MHRPGPPRARVRVRPAAVRLRRLGLQPEGRRQRPQLARRVHDDPRLPRGDRHRAPIRDELLSFPFLFMTGHKLVRFSRRERDAARPLRRAGRAAVLGRLQPRHRRAVRASRSRRRCARCFRAAGALAKLPATHRVYRSFFTFRRGAADDVARAERLGRRHRARLPARRGARRPARRALQQQGLRLRVGLRLAEQAVPAGGQHEVRGQYRRVCDDLGFERLDRGVREFGVPT